MPGQSATSLDCSKRGDCLPLFYSADLPLYFEGYFSRSWPEGLCIRFHAFLRYSPGRYFHTASIVESFPLLWLSSLLSRERIPPCCFFCELFSPSIKYFFLSLTSYLSRSEVTFNPVRPFFPPNWVNSVPGYSFCTWISRIELLSPQLLLFFFRLFRSHYPPSYLDEGLLQLFLAYFIYPVVGSDNPGVFFRGVVLHSHRLPLSRPS